MWTLDGVEFTSEDVPEDAVGYVYRMTNLQTGKKYIGKKNFYRVIVRPPLKGQKRKRRSKVQSDWQTYCSSSENVKTQIEELGIDSFKREILEICYAKGDLSYAELKHQVLLNVLFDDDYLNGIIQARINRKHLSANMKR